jgi:hypothetical protein
MSPLDRLSIAIRPWAVSARMDGYPHCPGNARPGRRGADGHALSSSVDGFLRSLYTALEGSHPAWDCPAGRVPDDSV